MVSKFVITFADELCLHKATPRKLAAYAQLPTLLFVTCNEETEEYYGAENCAKKTLVTNYANYANITILKRDIHSATVSRRHQIRSRELAWCATSVFLALKTLLYFSLVPSLIHHVFITNQKRYLDSDMFL